MIYNFIICIMLQNKTIIEFALREVFFLLRNTLTKKKFYKKNKKIKKNLKVIFIIK